MELRSAEELWHKIFLWWGIFYVDLFCFVKGGTVRDVNKRFVHILYHYIS